MKKEKGITLIALVITIVVLIILAAITINIVINGGIFSAVKEAKLFQANAIEYDYEVTGEWGNFINNKILEITKNNNASHGGTEEIVTNTSHGGTEEIVTNTIINDIIDSYEAYSIGEEVEIEVGGRTEHFYVLEASDENSDSVTLITKYNLNNTADDSGYFLGHYMQLPNANYGATWAAFASVEYWNDDFDYDSKLYYEDDPNSYDWGMHMSEFTIPNSETKDNNAIKRAIDYAEAIGGSDGRLLEYEEYYALYNDYRSMIDGEGNQQSNGNYLAYWVGCAINSDGIYIGCVDGHDSAYAVGTVDYSGQNYFGVRPVVTVPKSIIKN